MLNLLSPMILKIKITLAIIVAIVVGVLLFQINSLKKQNDTLETKVDSYAQTLFVYKEAIEAQSQQNSEDLTRYKFDRELQNDINKVKGTNKDTAIDPELVNIINKLQRSREQTSRADTK